MNKISKIKKIYILSFIFSFHIAISAYANSVFLSSYIKEDYVGMLYTVSSIITLLFLSSFSRILKSFGNKKVVMILLCLNMISLVGMITSINPVTIASSFIFFLSTNTLVLFCIDIFIEHFGDPNKTGKTRGLYLTLINTAWMLSPLLTSFLISKEGGYKTIYILAFIMVSIMTFGLLFSVKTFKDEKYKRVSFLKTFKFLRKNKNIFSIVFINFLLQFFYSWMVVYTPIYLIDHLGFSWDKIGIIFTIMLAPFVILGLPLGVFVDKYNLNKKKILSIGFIIIIISTSLISFITTKQVIIWAIILFITRIGASIIETIGEIYFFKNIKEEDTYLLGIYRDMNPVSYITAPILATIFFLILPFNLLFLILGIIMVSGLFIIPKLKN